MEKEKRRRPIVVLAVAALAATCLGAGGVLLADRLMEGGAGLNEDSSRRAAELTVATSGVATEVGLLLRQLESSGGAANPREALGELQRQGARARDLAGQVDADLPRDAPERKTLAKANRDLDRATREVVDSAGGEEGGNAVGAPSPDRVRVALAEVVGVGRAVDRLGDGLDLATAPGLEEQLKSATARLPREDVDIRLEANVALTGAGEDSLAGSQVAGVGDMDDDGQDDAAIAAQGESTVYVVPGDALESGTQGQLGDTGFAITSLPVDGTDTAIDDVPAIYDGTLEVAPAGDVNGDELADMLVAVATTEESTGVAYVIFGSRSAGDVDVESLGSRGYTIRGPGPYWGAGTSLTGVGDVNGDDRDDIAIGGRRHFGESGTTAAMGAAVTWVLLGGPARDEVRLPKQGGPADGFMIDGIGSSLAGVGDVNGDGLDDIAGGDAFNRMGAPGSGGIVFGSREPPQTIEVGEPGGWGLDLMVPQGRIMGSYVAGAGDQNGDGLADVAVGSHAFQTDVDELNDYPEPEVTVVYGRRSTTTVDLSSPGSDGAQLEGFGPTVAQAGDVNGDSVGDLVVETTRQITDLGPPIGGARVFFGRSADAPVTVGQTGVQRSGFALEGAGVPGPTSDLASEGRIGSVLAGAGDVDGDGSDDLILGAPYDGTTSEGIPARGSVFLVFAEPPQERTLPLAGTVSAGGLGSIRVGGSASEAGEVLGTEPFEQLEPCGFLPTPDSRVTFLLDGDTIARVEVDGPGYATDKGVEVGDSEASVSAAYGARVRRSEHEYVPEGSYLSVRTPMSDVPGAKVVFETDGDSVTLIRAGRTPEVNLVEGCA